MKRKFNIALYNEGLRNATLVAVATYMISNKCQSRRQFFFNYRWDFWVRLICLICACGTILKRKLKMSSSSIIKRSVGFWGKQAGNQVCRPVSRQAIGIDSVGVTPWRGLLFQNRTEFLRHFDEIFQKSFTARIIQPTHNKSITWKFRQS